MEQESTLIQRTLAGDEEAFTCLVEAYQTPVYNLAYRMLGSAVEAEDAAQETFLRLYTRLDTYDPEKSFSSWILSIASHHCIDRLRRRRHPQVSLDDVAGGRWLPSRETAPEEQALKEEERGEIMAHLDELPAHYRVVLILRYWHEKSYDEIADILGTTQSTVKSRLHRARKAMAERVLAQRTHRDLAYEERRVAENALLQGK